MKEDVENGYAGGGICPTRSIANIPGHSGIGRGNGFSPRPGSLATGGRVIHRENVGAMDFVMRTDHHGAAKPTRRLPALMRSRELLWL